MYLKNHLHEQFALLIATGHSATGAYRNLMPHVKNPHTLGAKLMKRHEVARRIDEIREEASFQGVMSLARKRALLAQMINGEIPTSTTKNSETYDMLGAIETDAKLAGELNGKAKALPITALDLKFDIPHRDTFFD